MCLSGRFERSGNVEGLSLLWFSEPPRCCAFGTSCSRKGPSVPTEPVIHARKLSFTYPTGPAALDDISFEIGTGECVGVVGSNGAGKTTLFLCLMGVLPP